MISENFNFQSFSVKIASPEYDECDPNFFDSSYTIAASTAYNVWESSLVFLDYVERNDDLAKLIKTHKIVELGSGTGITGIGLSKMGADVLLTDVEFVVPILQENIELNKVSAKADVLDWSKDISFVDCGLLVATDTVWLKDLSVLFVNAVSALLRQETETNVEFRGIKKPRICLWVYKERGTEKSRTFSTLPEILDLFAQSDCTVETIDTVTQTDEKVHIQVVYANN